MKNDPNFVCAWIESETSIQKEYVCDVFGIDPERFIFIEHQKDGAGELAIDIAESILSTGAIDMLVINSLKCLVPSTEFEKSMSEHTIGLQARMNSKMMRKLTPLVAENETAFILITHLTTSIGSMSYDPMIVAGGWAIIYGASIILDMRKKSISESDPISKTEGVKIGVSVKKNHCLPDRNPYQKCEYFAIFGEGIEQYLSVLEIAIKKGILSQSGAFIKDPDENGEPREWNGIRLSFQGKQKFRNFCIENPEYFKELQSKLEGNLSEVMTEEEVKEAINLEKTINETAEEDGKKTKKKK